MPFAQVPGADDLGFKAKRQDIAGFFWGGTSIQHVTIACFSKATIVFPGNAFPAGIAMVNDCDFIAELIFVVIAVAGGFLGIGADTVTDDLVGNAAVGDEFNGQADMLDHGVMMIFAEHGDHFGITAGLDSILALIAGAGDALDTLHGDITVERGDPFVGLRDNFHSVGASCKMTQLDG